MIDDFGDFIFYVGEVIDGNIIINDKFGLKIKEKQKYLIMYLNIIM